MTGNTLQRLFWRTGTDQARSHENFTTEALAVAIEADPRPMLTALGKVSWYGREHPSFDGYGIRQVRTQLSHADASGVKVGQIDLVLELAGDGLPDLVVWGEAKVAAPVSGKQLDVYDRERVRLPTTTLLISISAQPLSYLPSASPDMAVTVPWLSWKDIAAAVRETEDPDRWWTLLVEHLDVLGLAFSSRGAAPADGELILREVNGILRRSWPEAAGSLYWTAPKTMIDQAKNRAGEDGPFFTTGGPVAYGHRGADWFVSVGIVNAQGVTLDAEEIVRQADAAGLPGVWRRDPAGRERVLLASIPSDLAPMFAEAAIWFEERISELHASALLDAFLLTWDAHR